MSIFFSYEDLDVEDDMPEHQMEHLPDPDPDEVSDLNDLDLDEPIDWGQDAQDWIFNLPGSPEYTVYDPTLEPHLGDYRDFNLEHWEMKPKCINDKVE